MKEIREKFGVPAKRGGRVAYSDILGDEILGTIRSAKGDWLMIQLDPEKHPRAFRPDDRIRYLTDCPKENGSAVVRTTEEAWYWQVPCGGDLGAPPKMMVG